eukprot:GSChrysophyteH1.ASY1.ANO1.254.1 assembled CDS
MSSSFSARKLIPKKLEEDLANLPRYKPLARKEVPGMPAGGQKTVREVMDDSIERAMYDEILGPLVNPRSKSSVAHRNIIFSEPDDTRSRSSRTPHGSSFNGSILARLTSVEMENKDLTRQVAIKDARILELEEENRRMRRALEAEAEELAKETTQLLEQIQELREENQALESQVVEMEQFLADYGLEWVGQNPPDECESKDQRGNVQVDFHLFARKVQELNDMINNEPAQVRKDKHNERQARIMKPSEFTESIPITFYSNGLMIRRGPFRPADSASYKSFCRDILDGYFPSDFRKDHPDGVLFNLTDKHLEPFSGAESRNLVGGSLQESTTAQSYSRDDILRRIPVHKVLPNGDIVDIRSGIAARLGNKHEVSSSAPATSASSSEGARGDGKASSENDSETDSSKEGTALVRVKWLDGKMLHMKLWDSDLVGDVREHVRRYLYNQNIEEDTFELRGTYPPRALPNSMTLVEAGLVPNGTVHAKKI